MHLAIDGGGHPREALDQAVFVADLAALVFGVLLGTGTVSVCSADENAENRTYASTWSGVASSLQVTWDSISRETLGTGCAAAHDVGRHVDFV